MHLLERLPKREDKEKSISSEYTVKENARFLSHRRTRNCSASLIMKAIAHQLMNKTREEIQSGMRRRHLKF
jgi:hypothetical protein